MVKLKSSATFVIKHITQTDFECRYIVTSETLKQLELIFDKCID